MTKVFVPVAICPAPASASLHHHLANKSWFVKSKPIHHRQWVREEGAERNMFLQSISRLSESLGDLSVPSSLSDVRRWLPFPSDVTHPGRLHTHTLYRKRHTDADILTHVCMHTHTGLHTLACGTHSIPGETHGGWIGSSWRCTTPMCWEGLCASHSHTHPSLSSYLTLWSRYFSGTDSEGPLEQMLRYTFLFKHVCTCSQTHIHCMYSLSQYMWENSECAH